MHEVPLEQCEHISSASNTLRTLTLKSQPRLWTGWKTKILMQMKFVVSTETWNVNFLFTPTLGP